MSELKVYRPREFVMQGKHNEPVYIKSEADKVIAKKDKVIDFARALVREDIKLVFRHKYKRCLSMAAWCKLKSEINNEFAADASDYMPRYEARFRTKAVLYQKWAMHWLELAEKFKESK